MQLYLINVTLSYHQEAAGSKMLCLFLRDLQEHRGNLDRRDLQAGGFVCFYLSVSPQWTSDLLQILIVYSLSD